VLALVWLLSGVGANMNSQGTSLDEALATSWGQTRVWSLVGVDAVMSLQIGLSVERLWMVSRIHDSWGYAFTNLVAVCPVTLKGP
jgi:hypothetical protein